MIYLDDPKVGDFLTDWFILGEHQFGQFRNRTYSTSEEYKEFIEKCLAERVPAFASVQPKLILEKIFYEFDTKKKVKAGYKSSDLDDVWAEALVLAKTLEQNGASPIILYSGNRGYHVYASMGIFTFKPSQEDFARDFYKNVLFGLMGNREIFKNFDLVPTHVNVLARIPFSFHQNTLLQVVPLSVDREPYVPDVGNFRANQINKDIIDKYWRITINEHNSRELLYQPTEKPAYSNKKREIRQCIIDALKRDASHDARLAYMAEVLWTEDENEPLEERNKKIHEFMKQFSDYDYHKTQYQVDYARRRKASTRPIRPMKCTTLQEKGICNSSCRRFGDVWEKSLNISV